MSRLFPYFFGEKQDIPRFSSYQKKNASPQEIRPFFILLHDFSMKKDTPPDVSFQGRTFGRRRLSCISSDPGRVCAAANFTTSKIPLYVIIIALSCYALNIY